VSPESMLQEKAVARNRKLQCAIASGVKRVAICVVVAPGSDPFWRTREFKFRLGIGFPIRTLPPPRGRSLSLGLRHFASLVGHAAETVPDTVGFAIVPGFFI